jgi:probable phosphoglycerate mutase
MTDTLPAKGGQHPRAAAAEPPTELVLVRHGVTAWNRETRFQGHIDIPLAPEGHEQARRVAVRLTERSARSPVSALYSSDLARARDTAAPIGAALGLPVRIEPAVRERHYGRFEGLTPAELERDHAEPYARWRGRELDFELPGGGESLRAFHGRVRAALEALAARHPGERVVVVTHGGVLDCVHRIAAGIDLSEPRRLPIHNASLNAIARAGAGWQVLAWGEVDHLD